MIKDVEQYARSRHDPKYEAPKPPPYSLSGFGWGYDEADLFELWIQWEENGVMPDPGGYFDQSPEWRDMIHTLRRVYGVARHIIEQEVKARKSDDG